MIRSGPEDRGCKDRHRLLGEEVHYFYTL